jgi:hypothetical protein
MPPARTFDRWRLRPVAIRGRPSELLWEAPTGSGILERLRTEAELQSVGRSRFVGTLAHRNALWLEYRNFLRQAMSNFRAALDVENRSASLLYYYAMLNFAKAELLSAKPDLVRGFVKHGLTFNVTRAKSMGGDSLTVTEGVFRALYESRTGRPLAVGTRLPIKRLLANIPEIGDQLVTLGVANPSTGGILQLVAFSDPKAWIVLAVTPGVDLGAGNATGRYFRRAFREVDPPPDWRDRFGISRRWGAMAFFESLQTFPYTPSDETSRGAAASQAVASLSSIDDVLGHTTMGMFDAWLAPSLYRTKMLSMPPSLARYAVAFYASSLVRYRPSMFDAQVAPEQAYLFDAIARECAVPMLIDTISGLTGINHVFMAEDAMRL